MLACILLTVLLWSHPIAAQSGSCSLGLWQCNASSNELLVCKDSGWVTKSTCASGTVCSLNSAALFGCVSGGNAPVSTTYSKRKCRPRYSTSTASELSTSRTLSVVQSSKTFTNFPTTPTLPDVTIDLPTPSATQISSDAETTETPSPQIETSVTESSSPDTTTESDVVDNPVTTEIQVSTTASDMPETTTPSVNTLTMPPMTRTSRPPTGTEMPSRKYKFIVYWGQGSGFATDGKYQLPLNEYCQTGTFDIINLSFLAVFGGQTPTKFNLNFANFGAYDNTNGPVADSVKQSFESIGQQIRQCQNLGVKIVLALGGADGDHTVLSGMGTAFAETLHNSFFGGSSTDRPFGSDVVLDGIDWDIEDARSDPNEMVKVNQYLAGRNPGILVTAAPQCIFPDVNLGPAFVLPNAGFSFINMQFYNNPSCQLNGNFNFDVWVSQIAIPYNIPIAIGVPGSQQSAGSGFVSAATIKSTMDTVLASSTLAPWLYGVMTWDASSTSASGLAQGIRSALDAL